MQVRYPDSWYKARYNCTWAEYIERLKSNERYLAYSMPVEHFHLYSVGQIVREGWIDYVLCEVRERYVTPDSPRAESCLETTYSANGKVLLTMHHQRDIPIREFGQNAFNTHTSTLGGTNPKEAVPDCKVIDIALLAEKLVDGHPQYMRWIVGNTRKHKGYSRVSLAEQFAGKTHLKDEFQVKEKLTDNGDYQMELDVGRGAY